MTVSTNLAAIRERIEAAATRAHRDPAAVRLIGVTKGVDPSRVHQALDAGLLDFGENFVQEAETRIAALEAAATSAEWHFIGHLQSNKIAAALNLFDIIQSVDSLRLAEQINRRADAKIRVLLEVNVAQEASKFGFAPAEVSAAVARIGSLDHLELTGLMTVAPAGLDSGSVRPVFRELRELAAANGLEELSMGMTDDFEAAIEEGATMVRIGRAIFGERPS
ncbi:MAG: YggS family pyridoxal phosphate-dependent enzyme [Dehalococcoidia bacterium]|nr:YggS family pyridoxal phosphate-dependent enzyme [Dehalococcoidia bacterium]